MINIRHVSASGIIFPEDDPEMVFLEFRGEKYPVPVFRNSLCCLGGNWIGKEAAADKKPRDTFLREIGGELSFEKAEQDRGELVELGLLEKSSRYQMGACLKQPQAKDHEALAYVKDSIGRCARHFGDNIQRIPESVFASADPENTRTGMSYLNSFFEVPLPREIWGILTGLQARLGNLSNESTTVVIAAKEIVDRQMLCAWSYDRILQAFFRSKGIGCARGMRLIPNISLEWRPNPEKTYEEYQRLFLIEKKPG